MEKGRATILGVGAEPQPGPLHTQLATSLARGHEAMGHAQPWASMGVRPTTCLQGCTALPSHVQLPGLSAATGCPVADMLGEGP